MSLLGRLAAETEGRDPGNLCQPLKHRQVTWLRSLFKLRPEHFDAESITDLII